MLMSTDANNLVAHPMLIIEGNKEYFLHYAVAYIETFDKCDTAIMKYLLLN